MRSITMGLLLCALVAGCSSSADPKTKSVIAIAQVPPAVMKAAQAKEPAVKFDKVIKTAGGVYEVQGKTKAGKIVEVEVSESGDVLKVE